MNLNERAASLVERLVSHPDDWRIADHSIEGGGRYIDCGIEARGGLLTGIELAHGSRLGGLARGRDQAGRCGGPPHHDGPGDHRSPGAGLPGQPVRGLGHQGGEILRDGFGSHASGSGHRGGLRSHRASRIGSRDAIDGRGRRARDARPPTSAVVAKIAAACGVEPAVVTLLVAPTASLAGGVQIVARSIETALHKLAELKFDLSRIVSRPATALLPFPRSRPTISPQSDAPI